MKRAVATGVVAAVVTIALVGCRPASRTPPPPCTLEVTDDGQGGLALAFLLANPGRVQEQGSYQHPLIAFGLDVVVDGRPVAVMKPSHDEAVESRDIFIPPGGGVRLDTPIRLRFEPTRALADPHVWLIRSRQQPVMLRVALDLPGLDPRLCEATWPSR